MLAMGELRRGMVYSVGYGQQLLTMPYIDGENFAARGGQTRISRDCRSVSIINATPRRMRAAASMLPTQHLSTSIDADEANFAYLIGGRRADGHAFAGTEIVQAGASTVRDVKSLAGFIAIADRAAEASNLLRTWSPHFAVDLSWAA